MTCPSFNFRNRLTKPKVMKQKINLYNFFKSLIFENIVFGKHMASIYFSYTMLACLNFSEKPCLYRFHNWFLFFSSSYNFSKIFGYNAPHNTLVSEWLVVTGARKPFRKGTGWPRKNIHLLGVSGGAQVFAKQLYRYIFGLQMKNLTISDQYFQRFHCQKKIFVIAQNLTQLRNYR